MGSHVTLHTDAGSVIQIDPTARATPVSQQQQQQQQQQRYAGSGTDAYWGVNIDERLI